MAVPSPAFHKIGRAMEGIGQDTTGMDHDAKGLSQVTTGMGCNAGAEP